MVRAYFRNECSFEELEPFLNVIVSYRTSFNGAMEAVHEALLDFHQSAGVRGEVSRRLKKSATIYNKLMREPGLDLSRMHDIGGCRSVVGSRDDLYRIRDLIAERWNAKEIDYVSAPRTSGYRAIHMIVTQDGKQIEIQLRTEVMHTWAEMVEAFSMILNTNYKQDGDELVQQYMKAMSEIMIFSETGQSPSHEAVAIVERLRPQIAALIEGAKKTKEESTI